jgi:hypothetical protein
MREILMERVDVNFDRALDGDGAAAQVLDEVAAGKMDAYTGADRLAQLLGAKALTPT